MRHRLVYDSSMINDTVGHSRGLPLVNVLDVIMDESRDESITSPYRYESIRTSRGMDPALDSPPWREGPLLGDVGTAGRGDTGSGVQYRVYPGRVHQAGYPPCHVPVQVVYDPGLGLASSLVIYWLHRLTELRSPNN